MIMVKKLFRFTENGNSCIITDPETPRHWYNYLWNENGYCCQVSQIGHGRSYYLKEDNMCMINNNGARYIYIRDDETHVCWNVGEGPLHEPVKNYQCIQDIGYSMLSSEKNSICSSFRIYVPETGFHEVWKLTVHNKDSRSRNLSIFSAVTFEMEGFSYPRYYEPYRCMETLFDRELNGIYCHCAHPFAPHGRYNAFLASSEPVYAYDGDLTKFCGCSKTITKPDTSAYALLQRPDIVVKGLDCTNSETALLILGGVLQHKITLKPGEEKEIGYIFGVSESVHEARTVSNSYAASEVREREFIKAQKYHFDKYGSLSVKTPDEKINMIMNNWLKKQVDYCLFGKRGMRDNLQMAVAALNFRQDKAEEGILECLKHQFQDGSAVLSWYPYDDTIYSDQPFWIIWAVCELIKETGNYFLLEQRISWEDGGDATVLEHVKAAVSYLLNDKGSHGLIHIRYADWNDALNITDDPEAESVMLSHQTCLALKDLQKLMEKTGRTEYADFLALQYKILKKQINESAWDGDWYMRAISRKENIGSQNSAGSKIYLNAQTWAVLGDVADEERVEKLLLAIDGMEKDLGFPLNDPPYGEYSPHVGRMSGMLPGLYENGGIYCHATAFKILMDCKLGRGTKAIETLKKIMPDSDKNPSSVSGAEPYVFTNCYSTHPKYYGKTYSSWTTGTAAWSMLSVYEGILGIKREYDGLCIHPCLPPDWEYAEVTRTYRGSIYHIMIRNPEHLEKNYPEIWLDGTRINGMILPDLRDGRLHEVEVICRLEKG